MGKTLNGIIKSDDIQYVGSFCFIACLGGGVQVGVGRKNMSLNPTKLGLLKSEILF